MKSTMTLILSFSLMLTLAVGLFFERSSRRSPASKKPLELQLQSMFISDIAPKRLEGPILLRATFDENYVFEFGKDEKWEITRGERIPLDINIDINPSWIHSEQLDFKLELVSQSGFKNVLVRCAYVAEKVHDYNRGYQCYLPREKKSFLSYRLAEKGSKARGRAIVQK